MSSSNSQASSSKRSNQNGFLPITLVRPLPGKVSPYTDERCFTYCSQNTYGRAENKEPWCRSICIRRVFAHEVRNAIARDDHHFLHNEDNRPAAEKYVKYPLPPEGQRADEVPDGEAPSDEYERKIREKDAKHWEQGWYVWYSKSRWATQEKLDLMALDLVSQTEWYKRMAKERVESEIERKANLGMDRRQLGIPTMIITPPRPPLLDPSKQSLLIRFQSPFSEVSDRLKRAFTPTVNLWGLIYRSFENGTQQEFARRMCANALTKEPYVWAKDRCVSMWKMWRDHENSKGSK